VDDQCRQAILELVMRRPLLGLAVAAVVGTGTVANHYHRKEAPARIQVNGQVIYEGTAVFRNDRIMFPLNFAQQAGVRAFYDAGSRIAVLHQENDNIAVKAGSDTMLAFLSDGDRWLHEGNEAALGVPFDPLRVPAETAPIHEKNELCVPLRVVAAALHVDPSEVGWDSASRTASFTSPVPLYSPVDAPQPFTAPAFLARAFDATAAEAQP
jgi:hypothetical protein